jgi:hypothetical protein
MDGDNKAVRDPYPQVIEIVDHLAKGGILSAGNPDIGQADLP